MIEIVTGIEDEGEYLEPQKPVVKGTWRYHNGYFIVGNVRVMQVKIENIPEEKQQEFVDSILRTMNAAAKGYIQLQKSKSTSQKKINKSANQSGENKKVRLQINGAVTRHKLL